MIVIRLDTGEIRNRLQALGRVVDRPRAMMQSSAGYVRRELQRHFAERDKAPNRLGGRRTHFWGAVRNSTQIGAVTDRQAVIDIGDPRFAQKLRGGTIVAKTPWRGRSGGKPWYAAGFKLLTIPVDPAAHGRRASVLRREKGLKLWFMGNASGGVIATRAGKQGIRVLYACVPSVTQGPDPEALPPGDALDASALAGAEDYLRSKIPT